MKRRRRELGPCEPEMGIEEIARTGLAGAAPPVADSGGGADAMHDSLFLSFRLQLDFNATRTLFKNRTPSRSYSSSSVPSPANADSNATNVSASASRKRGGFRPPIPKSRFSSKLSSDPNNASVSGVIEETPMMTKRPRGRPRKNKAQAAAAALQDFPVTSAAEAPTLRRGRPPKVARKDASVEITTEVPRRCLLNAKHRFLQGKINKAVEFLGAAASAMQELQDIAAMDGGE